MQHRKLRLWGLIAILIVVSLALSGCGIFERRLSGSESESGTSDDQVSEPAIDPAIAALLPGEPAPVDSDFRADSAQVVAATGRPQLLEFFTYW